MRSFGFLFVVLMLASALGRPAHAQAANGICGAEGPVQIVCGPTRAEDIMLVPGTDWVVTSSMSDAGGLFLVNTKDKSSLQLYPSATAAEKLDKIYDGCATPPDAAEKAKFTTLGIALGGGKRGIYTLYAGRLPQATVHVFRLDVSKAAPSVTWIGCINPPAKALVNSIAPLSGGAFIASEFFERGEGAAAGRVKAEAGELTGDLWKWRPHKGWSIVPGGRGSGLNGISASKDEKWIFVSEWGAKRVYRLSLGLKKPQRDATVALDFRPDNMHWGTDGALLVTGATDTASVVVRIDPKTLQVTKLIEVPDSKDFIHASVAIRVGEDLWLGSARSNHLAIYPGQPRP